MLNDAFIASVLSDSRSSEESVNELIQAAKAAGGKDNISVVVCRILDQLKDECEDEVLEFNDTTITQ